MIIQVSVDVNKVMNLIRLNWIAWNAFTTKESACLFVQVLPKN